MGGDDAQCCLATSDLALLGFRCFSSFFVCFINVPNRTVEHDVGVCSFCGWLDIRRTPALTRSVGSVRPLQKVILGFENLWMHLFRPLHVFFVDTMMDR